MARYRYTINHPNVKAPARVSDIPTKAAIEQLSPETPSNGPDPLPVQELHTTRESDSLLTSSGSCSQARITKSAKREPIRNVVSRSIASDHHEILVGPNSTKLSGVTPLMKHETFDSAEHPHSAAAGSKITAFSPASGPSTVKVLELLSPPYQTLPVSWEATDTIALTSTSTARTGPRIEAFKDADEPQLSGVFDRNSSGLDDGVTTAAMKLGFLDIPAEIRIRIYNYVFRKGQRIAFYHHANTRGISARHSKHSGVGLRFTCHAIEAESRPMYHNYLIWELKTPGPVNLASLSIFHDTSAVGCIILPAKTNVDRVNEVYQNRVYLPALTLVIVQTTGQLRTDHVPSRIKRNEMMDRLQLWSGFPRRLEAVMRQPDRTYEIALVVECAYYPYMKGKARFWHDVEGGRLWSSQVKHKALKN
jgi:hypothetical protein